jgi:hypothetical protein
MEHYCFLSASPIFLSKIVLTFKTRNLGNLKEELNKTRKFLKINLCAKI